MRKLLSSVVLMILAINVFGDDKSDPNDQDLIDNAHAQVIVHTTTQPVVTEKKHKVIQPVKSSPVDKVSQKQIDQAIKASNQQVLIDANSSRIVPKGIEQTGVQYPNDWAEKTKKREKYKDGILYQGPVLNDSNGNQQQLVIYDITDLIVETPNFSYDKEMKSRVDSYNQGSMFNNFDLWRMDGVYGPVTKEKDYYDAESLGPTYSEDKLIAILKMVKVISPDAEIMAVAPELKKEKKN